MARISNIFSLRPHKGFTLIELLIVIAMLSTLFVALLFAINPVEQVNKAKDATRQHDIMTIKSALDAYYNDHGCYPASMTFSGAFSQGSTIYIKTVPNDPDVNPPYVYETDGSNCPQWNVLFSRLRSSSINVQSKTLCSLADHTNCLPTNYAAIGFNYCAVSGNIDCTYIANSSLVVPTPTIAPTPTTFIPTPTTNPCPPQNRIYSCAGSAPSIRCNVVGTIGQGGGTYCTSNCDGMCQ